MPACRPVYSATDATSGSIVTAAALLDRRRHHARPPSSLRCSRPAVAQNRPPLSPAERYESPSSPAGNAADVPTVSFKPHEGIRGLYSGGHGVRPSSATPSTRAASTTSPRSRRACRAIGPRRPGFARLYLPCPGRNDSASYSSELRTDRAIQLARHVAGVVNETTALALSAPVEGAPYDKRYGGCRHVQVEPDRFPSTSSPNGAV